MINDYPKIGKSHMHILSKKSGRNNTGKVTTRHQGGREKRYYREIDFKRDKRNIKGEIVAIEYDPNRNVEIALVYYPDGEKRFILRPLGMNVRDTVLAGEDAEVKPGNSLPLARLPVGTVIHNVELHKGVGGQIIRGAGTMGMILSHEDLYAHVKLPSGEVRKIRKECYATVGQLANVERKTEILGKAGRSRHLGIRPTVRGTAQDPRSHPHGGGEGRSGEGMKQPKTPWGKPARGLKTRKRRRYSNKMIIQRRK